MDEKHFVLGGISYRGRGGRSASTLSLDSHAGFWDEAVDDVLPSSPIQKSSVKEGDVVDVVSS